MANQTAQLFDLMFKYILKEASSPAVVHFINGLFDKKYKPSSKVEFLQSESVSEQKGRLAKIVSDIPLSINSDYYLIEAQISEDLDITLRAFQYAFVLAKSNKAISEDGSLIKLELPEPKIIYFENPDTVPDFVTVEIKYPKGEFSYKVPAFKILENPISEFERRNLDLLLPFYLLKFRRELQKKNVRSEKRKEIANRMADLISEIDQILERHSKKNVISREDASLLAHELAIMHDELYGNYKEFKEVNMTLMEKVKTRNDEFEKRGIKIGEKRGEKRGALMVLELVEQGYKLAAIKKKILPRLSK
jgi:hypothetical protein